MKKVMAFGTFDIVHPGHIFFLENAKKLGDYLVVVISRDQTVQELKKHKTRNAEKSRFNKIKSLGLADKVVLGSLGDKLAVVRDESPNIIALGYDQKFLTAELRENFGDTIEIVRLEAFKPEIYKSSKIAASL